MAAAYRPGAVRTDAAERERFRPGDPAAEALSAIAANEARANPAIADRQANHPHQETHHV